jgi:hypothetical protein
MRPAAMLTAFAPALVLAGLLTACDKSPTIPTGLTLATGPGPSWSLTGIVLESGTHAPVPDARVCVYELVESCAMTKQDGSYTLDVSHISPCPYVEKQGFESLGDHVAVGQSIWSPRLQQLTRVEAGQTVASTVFPDDASGQFCIDDYDDDYCAICKRIRIVATHNGKLALRLTPENAGLSLAWVASNRCPPGRFRSGPERRYKCSS